MSATRKSTFSIVAADLEAGEVGCAVQSKYFSVGSVVPWARAGVGACATQAAGVAVFGRRALEELDRGLSPDEALERVLAEDSGRETRQLGLVTADGRAAAFTGSACLDWAGHRVGAGFAAQGNILAGEAVVDEMARAFETVVGPLAHRLVAALEAGQAAGGDKRGQQSAALVVERTGARTESREGIDREAEAVDQFQFSNSNMALLFGSIPVGKDNALYKKQALAGSKTLEEVLGSDSDQANTPANAAKKKANAEKKSVPASENLKQSGVRGGQGIMVKSKLPPPPPPSAAPPTEEEKNQ